MTARVEFHTGVDDLLGFACRLLRKAYRSGAQVLVTAPPATLAALDEALWTFEDAEFVPHVRLGGERDALAQRSPIWLAAELPAPPCPAVWVNLGTDCAADDVAFERIIEVVASDADARRVGRERWRLYESLGLKAEHHAIGQ